MVQIGQKGKPPEQHLEKWCFKFSGYMIGGAGWLAGTQGSEQQLSCFLNLQCNLKTRKGQASPARPLRTEHYLPSPWKGGKGPQNSPLPLVPPGPLCITSSLYSRLHHAKAKENGWKDPAKSFRFRLMHFRFSCLWTRAPPAGYPPPDADPNRSSLHVHLEIFVGNEAKKPHTVHNNHSPLPQHGTS